jgi:DNA polymerase-1
VYVQTNAFAYHRFDDPTKRVVTDTREFWDVIRYLSQFREAAYDCETSGLAWFRHARMCGISVSVWNPNGPGTLSWYFPFRHQTGEAQLPPDTVLAGMRHILENPNITKIAHNIKFERHLLAREGMFFAGPLRDTMIEAHLYNENAPSGLKPRTLIDLKDPAPTAHEHILNTVLKQLAKEARMGITAYKDAFGYAQIPIGVCGQYACYDTDSCLKLAAFYDAQGVRSFFASIYDTELRLTEALFEMEEAGIPIDAPYLEHLKRMTAAAKEEIAPRIFAGLGGYAFNLGSDDELRDVLIRRMGIPLFKRTEGNKLAVDKEVLESFADEHPLCSQIIEWRQASKIETTYTDSILSRVDANNVLHGDFKQLGTKTGRMSAEKPNMQNFAGDSDARALAATGKKLEDGGRDPWSVKRAFQNRGPGWMRGYFDYSQIELRVLAEYSRDPTMIDVYAKGEDIHARTSMEVFGNTDKATRRHAKVINFGLSYCLSPAGFSRQAKISMEDAERHMTNFFKKYPRISPFRDEFWAYVRRNKCTFQNMFGRPRRVPELASQEGWMRGSAERRSIGSLIQGTAAELTKISLVRILEWEKHNRSGLKLVSTIHDEISLDIPLPHSVEVGRAVKSMMESYRDYFHLVPIVTDAEKSTESWADKHKWEELKEKT